VKGKWKKTFIPLKGMFLVIVLTRKNLKAQSSLLKKETNFQIE